MTNQSPEPIVDPKGAVIAQIERCKERIAYYQKYEDIYAKMHVNRLKKAIEKAEAIMTEEPNKLDVAYNAIADVR